MGLRLIIFPTVAAAFTTDQFELMGDVTRFGCYGIAMVMVFLGPLVHFKSGNLASLWMLASYILYTRWFGTMNIAASKYFDAFAISVGKSTNPREVFGIGEADAVDQRRMISFGVDSPLFLRNSEQLLLGLACLVFIVSSCMLLGRGEGDSCLQVLRRKVQFSLIILGWLLGYQDLLVYALLQAQRFSVETALETVSSLASAFYLVCAAIFAVFVPGVLYRKRTSVVAGNSRDCVKWGVLVEGLRPGMPLFKYQLYTVYLAQRIIAGGIYVFLYKLENVQVLCMLVLEVCVLVWYIAARPFGRMMDNLACVLLQACVCLLLLFLGCFCRSWQDSEETFLTFTYVGVYLFGLFVCLLRFGFSLYSSTPTIEIKETDDSKSDIKNETIGEARLNVTREDNGTIRSQFPNEPYERISKLSNIVRVKQTRVAPLSASTTEGGKSSGFGWIGTKERLQAGL